MDVVQAKRYGMADTPIYKAWQVPAQMAPEDTRLGWLNESTEQGLAWLKSQRGSRDWKKSIDIISGTDSTAAIQADYRSRLNTNRLKRNIRQIVATMAKLRPFWGYHSDNKAYSLQAEMMNKTTRAWYLEQFADRSIKQSLQWAAATGRGWIRPIYRRDMGGTGRGDIKLLSYGAPSVLPVQLPSSGDWQAAYSVTVMDEMPVYMAHGMFPLFQSRLLPTSSKYWYSNDGVRVAAKGNILQRMFGVGKIKTNDPMLDDLLVPIRYTTVIDLSINTTDKPIPMGEVGSSWAYTVPFIGQQIETGIDIATGKPTYREANENDCRLYPNRRQIISTDTCIMYDGPAFDWHGMLGLVSFSVDDWPWEPNGFSLVHDGWEIQDATNKIYRGNMDKVVAELDPALGYDQNAVSSRDARSFDPLQPRGRIGYDGSALEGAPFTPVMPKETLMIQQGSMELAAKLEEVMDSQQAVSDVMTLARMRAVGSMDELEKVMESSGPIVDDMSRSMEPPMRDLGVMVKYLILQYYTTPRVMQIVGVDGVAPTVFDYDPSSIVPSHLAGEDPKNPSLHTAMKRARTFADNLRFFIMPHSLHEMQQMAMKLGLIQLRKAGVMIDSQTIAEAWGVPNYGQIDGSTVMEKYHNEKQGELEFAAKMKQIADAETGEIPNTAPPGAPGLDGSNPEGRPPSGQAAPALKQKDGGTRSTITESK